MVVHNIADGGGGGGEWRGGTGAGAVGGWYIYLNQRERNRYGIKMLQLILI